MSAKRVNKNHMTKSAFARLAGVHPSSVRTAISAGKIDLIGEGKAEKVVVNGAKTKAYLAIQKSKPETRGKHSDPNSPTAEKTRYEMEKIKAQTTMQNIDIAEKIGLLMPRTEVEKVFAVLSGCITNYFFPFGDRLAPICAAICEVDDPEKVLKLKEAIDKETMRALKQFKKSAVAEYKKK